MKNKKCIVTGLILFLCFHLSARDLNVNIKVDISETPHLEKWSKDAKVLMLKWYPRIVNLLPSKGHKFPESITLKFKKTDKGIAYASGTVITVCSGWVEKHPKDIGLVVHELVHVLQGYKKGNPSWLTEGIADYIRWALYEGKTQADFHRPKEKDAYKKGYQATAGFLLWLEGERSPGIVNKLNARMRRGEYSDQLFKEYTKKSLNELWNAYAKGSTSG